MNVLDENGLNYFYGKINDKFVSSVEVNGDVLTPTNGNITVPINITNKNLLDNWYFIGGSTTGAYGTFPVNQRKQGSYSGTGYGVDRWLISANNITEELLSDGIELTVPTTVVSSGIVIRQPLSQAFFLKGKTYTASILVKEISGAFRIWFGSRGTSANRSSYVQFNTPGLFKVTGLIDADITDFVFAIARVSNSAIATIKIQAIKLELGDTQTLAHNEGTTENPIWVLNELPDYEEQLIQCKTSCVDPSDIYANMVISYNTPNPNLLDNWYFVGGGTGYGVFPVKQRGGSIASGTNYFIDRWKGLSSYASEEIPSSNNCIKLSLGASQSSGKLAFGQPFGLIRKGTYTISALIKSTSGSFAISFGSYGTSANRITSSNFSGYCLIQKTGTFSVDIADGYFFVNTRTAGESNIEIVAVKVEIGNTQTLAHNEGTEADPNWVLNEIPNYEEQLIRCQTSQADPSDTYANKVISTTKDIDTITNSKLSDAFSTVRFVMGYGGSSIKFNVNNGLRALLLLTSHYEGYGGIYTLAVNGSTGNVVVYPLIAASGNVTIKDNVINELTINTDKTVFATIMVFSGTASLQT